MCIINEPADVSQTQIFVSANQKGDRQFTCYANAVMTQSENNVMVLPVRRPKTVLFHDLSEYKEIFDDLEESFQEHSFGMENCLGARSLCADEDRWVPVQDLGSYRVSLVMCHEDLERVDPREFGQIHSHIKGILAKHYKVQQGPDPSTRTEWGFVVCKLAPGKLKQYHPLAYSNAILPNDQLFVPTRHQHNHDGEQSGQEHGEERVSDWDHAIYSFNTSCSCGNRGRTTNDIDLERKKIPDFKFPRDVSEFQKLRIKGRSSNRDYWFQVVC